MNNVWMNAPPPTTKEMNIVNTASLNAKFAMMKTPANNVKQAWSSLVTKPSAESVKKDVHLVLEETATLVNQDILQNSTMILWVEIGLWNVWKSAQILTTNNKDIVFLAWLKTVLNVTVLMNVRYAPKDIKEITKDTVKCYSVIFLIVMFAKITKSVRNAKKDTHWKEKTEQINV